MRWRARKPDAAEMSALMSLEMESALEDMLKRETAELAQFIALLEEELSALANCEPEIVEQCVSRKQTVLGRIFATRDAVNALTRRAASNPQLESAEAWLARTSSARITQAFQQLTDHAEYARELNQLTGRLVQVKLRSVNERLDILQPAGWMGAMYYPAGLAGSKITTKGIIGTA